MAKGPAFYTGGPVFSMSSAAKNVADVGFPESVVTTRCLEGRQPPRCGPAGYRLRVNFEQFSHLAGGQNDLIWPQADRSMVQVSRHALYRTLNDLCNKAQRVP